MSISEKFIYCSECGKKNRVKKPHLPGIWSCGSCGETIFDNRNSTKAPKRRKGWDKFISNTLQELVEAKAQLRQARSIGSKRVDVDSIKKRSEKIKSRFESLKAHLDYIADENERREIGNLYRVEFILIQDMITDIDSAPHNRGFWHRFSKINSNTAAVVGSLSSITILAGAILSTVGIPNPLMVIGYQMRGQDMAALPKSIEV